MSEQEVPRLNDAVRFLDAVRQTKKKIILATGVFDLLHNEHKLFLEKAKAAGDVLVVGVECDLRVKQIKGSDRPIWPETKRVSELQALPYVDFVFILPSQFNSPADHEGLIASLKPAVLAVSSHTDHLAAKQAILEKYGGTVQVVHQHNPAVSTSRVLEKKVTLKK